MTDHEFDALARQVDSAIPEVHCVQCVYLERTLVGDVLCAHPHALLSGQAWSTLRQVRLPARVRNADGHCSDYIAYTFRTSLARNPVGTLGGVVVLLGIAGTVGWVAVQVLAMLWQHLRW